MRSRVSSQLPIVSEPKCYSCSLYGEVDRSSVDADKRLIAAAVRPVSHACSFKSHYDYSSTSFFFGGGGEALVGGELKDLYSS